VKAKSYPAGWYPDPWDPESVTRARYWDGKQWTSHVNDSLPVDPSDPVLWQGIMTKGKISEKEDSDERRRRQSSMEPFSFSSWSGLPDPLRNLVMALGFLFLLLIMVFLLLLPRLGSDDDPEAESTTTTTLACQSGEFDAVPGIDPCVTTTQSPATTASRAGATPCEPLEYAGGVTAAVASGTVPDQFLVNQVTGARGADCSAGIHIFWVGVASVEATFNNPEGQHCWALLGGGGGTVDSDGSFSGFLTMNAGSFEPWIGADESGPRTCQEIIDRNEVGSYLGQRGNDAVGVVTDDKFLIEDFSTDINQGPPLITVTMELKP
jgi:hypothetical protein